MPQARAIVPDYGGVRAGYNDTGSEIPKHRIVKRTTTTDYVVAATDGSAPIEGVTMEAIPDDYTGNVQHVGRAIVEAGEAITVGANVTGGTAGKGAVAAADDHILGVANTAAADDGDLIEVDIIKTQLPDT